MLSLLRTCAIVVCGIVVVWMFILFAIFTVASIFVALGFVEQNKEVKIITK